MWRNDTHCGHQGALRLGDGARRQLRFRSVGRALRLTDKFVGATAVPPLATRPRRCSAASAAMPERRQLPAYRALGALAARGSALLSEGLSISLSKCLDGRSARMLCAVAFRPLLGVGDRGHIDGSATEARGLIAGIEQRCRGPIVW